MTAPLIPQATALSNLLLHAYAMSCLFNVLDKSTSIRASTPLRRHLIHPLNHGAALTAEDVQNAEQVQTDIVGA